MGDQRVRSRVRSASAKVSAIGSVSDICSLLRKGRIARLRRPCRRGSRCATLVGTAGHVGEVAHQHESIDSEILEAPHRVDVERIPGRRRDRDLERAEIRRPVDFLVQTRELVDGFTGLIDVEEESVPTLRVASRRVGAPPSTYRSRGSVAPVAAWVAGGTGYRRTTRSRRGTTAAPRPTARAARRRTRRRDDRAC